MPIRILIADDHAVVRDGLSMILSAQDDITVEGTAVNGRDAINLAKRLQPDIILMDISMPELNGIEATRNIYRQLPEIKIIILSMHHTSEHVYRAIQAGAWGYLLKESAGNEIVTAIRTVQRGKKYFSAGIEEAFRSQGHNLEQTAESPLESLSQREREVLQHVVEGKTSAEIAQLIFISPKSVDTYRSRLMVKLGVHNLPALIRYAIENGISPS